MNDKDKSGLTILREQFSWPSEKPCVFPNPVPEGLAGWMAEEVGETLKKFGESKDSALWLELGTWLGVSAKTVLNSSPNSFLIAVDDWTTGVTHPETVSFMPRLFEIFCDECWQYRDRLQPIKMKTLDGIQLISELGICPDFVFIDADHRYEAIKKDFTTILDLFPSAIVLGDDYGQPDTPLFGVTRAVNDIVAERGLKILTNGSAWWIDK